MIENNCAAPIHTNHRLSATALQSIRSQSSLIFSFSNFKQTRWPVPQIKSTLSSVLKKLCEKSLTVAIRNFPQSFFCSRCNAARPALGIAWSRPIKRNSGTLNALSQQFSCSFLYLVYIITLRTRNVNTKVYNLFFIYCIFFFLLYTL